MFIPIGCLAAGYGYIIYDYWPQLTSIEIFSAAETTHLFLFILATLLAYIFAVVLFALWRQFPDHLVARLSDSVKDEFSQQIKGTVTRVVLTRSGGFFLELHKTGRKIIAHRLYGPAPMLIDLYAALDINRHLGINGEWRPPEVDLARLLIGYMLRDQDVAGAEIRLRAICHQLLSVEKYDSSDRQNPGL